MNILCFVFLGLFALSAARPSDIIDFEVDTDNLEHEHEQEGVAGKAVEGEYSWTAPNGEELYVKYIADHLGYRVVESNALPEAPEFDLNQPRTEVVEEEEEKYVPSRTVVVEENEDVPQFRAAEDESDEDESVAWYRAAKDSDEDETVAWYRAAKNSDEDETVAWYRAAEDSDEEETVAWYRAAEDSDEEETVAWYRAVEDSDED